MGCILDAASGPREVTKVMSGPGSRTEQVLAHRTLSSAVIPTPAGPIRCPRPASTKRSDVTSRLLHAFNAEGLVNIVGGRGTTPEHIGAMPRLSHRWLHVRGHGSTSTRTLHDSVLPGNLEQGVIKTTARGTLHGLSDSVKSPLASRLLALLCEIAPILDAVAVFTKVAVKTPPACRATTWRCTRSRSRLCARAARCRWCGRWRGARCATRRSWCRQRWQSALLRRGP